MFTFCGKGEAETFVLPANRFQLTAILVFNVRDGRLFRCVKTKLFQFKHGERPRNCSVFLSLNGVRFLSQSLSAAMPAERKPTAHFLSVFNI